MGDPRARARWPIRTFALGAEPVDDLRATSSAEERLLMMEVLALEAWALTGRPLPDYARDRCPILVRPLVS